MIVNYLKTHQCSCYRNGKINLRVFHALCTIYITIRNRTKKKKKKKKNRQKKKKSYNALTVNIQRKRRLKRIGTTVCKSLRINESLIDKVYFERNISGADIWI